MALLFVEIAPSDTDGHLEMLGTLLRHSAAVTRALTEHPSIDVSLQESLSLLLMSLTEQTHRLAEALHEALFDKERGE